jgi:hypothetical protein
MDYFRIRNWTTYQHYAKRNPPWIKLYTSLLDDYEFLSLPDATKLLAFFLLMLAAKTGNKMPLSPDWLQTRLNLAEKPDLDPLFSFGLIELHDASIMTLASDACIKEQSRDRGERKKEGEIASPEFRTRSLKDALPKILGRVSR